LGCSTTFSNPRTGKHPLTGRALFEITLRRLTPEESVDFLEKGFRQTGARITQEFIQEAVARCFSMVCSEEDRDSF